ncbi:MAG TPA: class I SAM-dependent methyltransferase [Bacteroidales bacterium]|nr:class I SAM-dependent methyltransferase [Bacteroidales bacterium]
MKQAETKYNKDDVKNFWNRNVCQTEFIKGQKTGSKEFFEEAEKIRYKYHFYLPGLFKWIAEQKPKGTLLELGCSMGTDLLQLARQGMIVNGIDLTEEGIKLGEERFEMYGIPANLMVGDAENIPFDDCTFDVVYSFGVLHHTPDTQKSINEARRVLKQDGIAVIMLYNTRSFNYIIHRILNAPFDGNKKDRCPIERSYTKKQVLQLFSEYSSVKIEKEYFMTTGFGFLWHLIPRFIHRFMGHVWGWHWVIKANK